MRLCAAAILLSTALLAGCGPKIVYIPVSSCPAPPVITMPESAVDRLPKKPETREALKAMAEDLVARSNVLEQCLTALEGYRK